MCQQGVSLNMVREGWLGSRPWHREQDPEMESEGFPAMNGICGYEKKLFLGLASLKTPGAVCFYKL